MKKGFFCCIRGERRKQLCIKDQSCLFVVRLSFASRLFVSLKRVLCLLLFCSVHFSFFFSLITLDTKEQEEEEELRKKFFTVDVVISIARSDERFFISMEIVSSHASIQCNIQSH